MEGLLLGDLADISQRGADIVHREIVFTLNLFKGHTTGQAADDDCDGHTGTTDHRLTMSDIRIDNDAILGSHNEQDSTGFASTRRPVEARAGIEPA